MIEVFPELKISLFLNWLEHSSQVLLVVGIVVGLDWRSGYPQNPRHLMLLHPHRNVMIWELPGVAGVGVGCPVGETWPSSGSSPAPLQLLLSLFGGLPALLKASASGG